MAKRKKTKPNDHKLRAAERAANPPQFSLDPGSINMADTMQAAITRANAALRASNAIAVSREQAWSHNMINGAIIGHLLVLWPMILGVVFFFMSRAADTRSMAVAAVATGTLALLSAWFAMAASEKGGNGLCKAVAAFFTVLSWGFVLGCALQSIR